MTVAEFLEQFNWAPYDDTELAESASKVEGEVGEKARAFLKAQSEFDSALEKINFERG